MKYLALFLALSVSAYTAGSSRAKVAYSGVACEEAGKRIEGKAREDLPAQTAAVDKHRQLRAELSEPMPNEPTMILLHAVGGHLPTSEYGIIAYRSANATSSATAVGRCKIWIEGVPFRPTGKKKWDLGAAEAKRLDQIRGDRCFCGEPASFYGGLGPPRRSAMSMQLEVLTPTRQVTLTAVRQG